MKTLAAYQISLKALIRKGDEFLFLRTPKRKLFDLPGGRIDLDEYEAPIAKIIEREVQEELGEKVKYKLGNLVFQFRRHGKAPTPVFLAVYEAEYLSGEPQLSNEHSGFQWINPKKDGLKKEDFFNDEEYLAFKAYFDNLA